MTTTHSTMPPVEMVSSTLNGPRMRYDFRLVCAMYAYSAEVSVDSRKKKKKKARKDTWNATQKCKSLQEVLDEADYHKYPSWVPNFVSIAAAPSRYPPRHFCSVSGLVGKYKCPVTGDYLATQEAYDTHRETRLKGARWVGYYHVNVTVVSPRPYLSCVRTAGLI